MNSVIGNNRRSCASGFDPKLNPATAAVDQLKFFPEWECQHLTLLSERDGYFGDPLDENDDYCIYDMQILGYEKLTRGGFSMTALSQVSESISRDCKLAVRTNPTTPLSESPQDIRNFYSIQKTKRDNDTLTKKQRPLTFEEYYNGRERDKIQHENDNYRSGISSGVITTSIALVFEERIRSKKEKVKQSELKEIIL